MYAFIAQESILEECANEQMVKYAITPEGDKHYPWGGAGVFKVCVERTVFVESVASGTRSH